MTATLLQYNTNLRAFCLTAFVSVYVWFIRLWGFFYKHFFCMFARTFWSVTVWRGDFINVVTALIWSHIELKLFNSKLFFPFFFSKRKFSDPGKGEQKRLFFRPRNWSEQVAPPQWKAELSTQLARKGWSAPPQTPPPPPPLLLILFSYFHHLEPRTVSLQLPECRLR